MALLIKHNLLPKIKLVIWYFSRVSASFYIENSIQYKFTHYTTYSMFMSRTHTRYKLKFGHNILI